MLLNSILIIVLWFYIAFCTLLYEANNENCSISVDGHTSTSINQSMLFRASILGSKANDIVSVGFPIIDEDDTIVIIRKREVVDAVCAGASNRFVLSRKVSSTIPYILGSGEVAVTSRSKNEAEGFRKKDYNEYGNRVKAMVKDTNQRCERIGRSYQIGYEFEGWHIMIFSCFNKLLANTLYTKHQLLPAAYNAIKISTASANFETNDCNTTHPYIDFDLHVYYRTEHQKATFYEIFGETKGEEYFNIDKGFYLIPGQLSPYSDFAFPSEQYSTFSWINSTPRWQSVNSGNWKIVEEMIQKYASRADKELTILSGVHSVFSLKDDKDHLQSLFFNRNNIDRQMVPVPLYNWKFVYDPSDKSGIGFVTLNDPFAGSNSKIPHCKESCSHYEWVLGDSKKQFIDGTKGLTFCCEFRYLRQLVSVPFMDVQMALNNVFTSTDRFKTATSLKPTARVNT